jgi:hypothetical protein
MWNETALMSCGQNSTCKTGGPVLTSARGKKAHKQGEYQVDSECTFCNLPDVESGEAVKKWSSVYSKLEAT